MKDSKKLFPIIVIAVVIFSLIYVSILLAAKTIIASKIQKATGLKTTISSLIILPPLNIEVRGFEIAGLIKAKRIYLAPSMRSFLFGKIAFNKIMIGGPEVTYQRDSVAEPVNDLRAPIVENKIQPVAPVTRQNMSLPVIIKSLKVYSGRLNFIDTTAASGKISVTVKDINFYITNLSTARVKGVSNFNLNGNLSWNTGEPDGKISLRGWVDLYKKDMLATLKIEDIDAIVFYPYYSTWVDLGKARIDKAKLSFNSDIKGQNNEVTANCHLELIDMVRKVRSPEEPQLKAEKVTDVVLDMLKSMDNGKVVLDFVLHTKMDQPEFGFANIKSAFEGKLAQARTSAGMRPQDVLLWPGHWLKSAIKSGTDLSNAFVDGVFGLGDNIKKFFENNLDKSVPVQAE